MADTKQVKTIGEHHVAAELARRGWAPALTRDGLERTDILAVLTEVSGRRLVEIQVKTTLRPDWKNVNWLIGTKGQTASEHEREYFVLVAVNKDLNLPPRNFILPRAHLWAGTWIQHMDWQTDPTVPAGTRNTPIAQSRVHLAHVAGYENRWDLLLVDEKDAPVLLPPYFRSLAMGRRVGLPPGHRWNTEIPLW